MVALKLQPSDRTGPHIQRAQGEMGHWRRRRPQGNEEVPEEEDRWTQPIIASAWWSSRPAEVLRLLATATTKWLWTVGSRSGD